MHMVYSNKLGPIFRMSKTSLHRAHKMLSENGNKWLRMQLAAYSRSPQSYPYRECTSACTVNGAVGFCFKYTIITLPRPQASLLRLKGGLCVLGLILSGLRGVVGLTRLALQPSIPALPFSRLTASTDRRLWTRHIDTAEKCNRACAMMSRFLDVVIVSK